MLNKTRFLVHVVQKLLNMEYVCIFTIRLQKRDFRIHKKWNLQRKLFRLQTTKYNPNFQQFERAHKMLYVENYNNI